MAGLDIEPVWFFDGRVQVDQPKIGYRAGTDAILLAMASAVKSEDRVLDMGTGSGILPCLLRHRFPKCEIIGFENDLDMLTLARHNVDRRKTIKIFDQNIADIPKSFNQSFDCVVSNPPFFDDIKSVRMSQSKCAAFVSDEIVLDAWIRTMVLMLKPRGIGTLICRADRVDSVFAGLYKVAGRIRILPIQSYMDTPANRILAQFRKSVKSESKILPALVMHDENPDLRYTKTATSILNGDIPIIMA